MGETIPVSETIEEYIRSHPFDLVAFRDLGSELRRESRDGEADHGRLLAARRLLSKFMLDGKRTARELEELGGILRDVLTLDAPLDFDSYAQAMEFDRSPESRLWLPRRRCLWRLYEELQWFETDPEAKFLSVSQPPRTGKSSVCSLAMTWHMGRNPVPSNLMTAHSDKLTKHFYQQCLQFVQDPEYRFAEIFPDSPLVWQSAEDESFSLQKRRAYPTCTCRSVEGTLTGAVEVGEGGWLYADDLVKDLEEAMSPRRLEGKWEAYINQCYDRRKVGSKQLMVGTRWDRNDPIGRMTRLHEGEPGFHTLTIPALDPDTGESNFDYLYGVGFDREYYVDMRKTTDAATYAAKYDGKPIVREGQLFEPDKLERFVSLPQGEPSRVVAVVDTKTTGSDYASMPIAAQWDNQSKWFIIDVICDNGVPELVNRRIANALISHNVQQARFESNAAGGKVADDISKALAEAGALCAVSKKYTMSNKETRILAASPWITNNCVFADPSLYQVGSDYERFMGQLCGYVLDGKNEHDDAPDSMSMLADLLGHHMRATVKAVKRPF